ncbi:hypothetical protein CTheo_508 [Ceratobasidium theobromae]|uniref:Homeobox domain-containing protein n=1 Tax=Ceratobasidium theobromae TaxID=1582974 RepID=A0A5N5QWK4_9AGAM|nr:hypothetical protein CTheo_508 [Ceratobasidium theobromae]
MPRISAQHTSRRSSHGQDGGALPKRVQAGARVHVTYQEFVQFMELWDASKGRPNREQIAELGTKLGRHVAHLAVWFSNRRQNIANEARRIGRQLTAKEQSNILWSKYRETAAERENAAEREAVDVAATGSRSTSSSPGKSASPVPSLSDDSSSSISDWSPTASPEAPVATLEDVSVLSPLDALLHVANREKNVYEACEALLGLGCPH